MTNQYTPLDEIRPDQPAPTPMADLHPEVLALIEAGPQFVWDSFTKTRRNETEYECRARIALRAVELERERLVWYCGCGHFNGFNLAECAMCGRDPAGRDRSQR